MNPHAATNADTHILTITATGPGAQDVLDRIRTHADTLHIRPLSPRFHAALAETNPDRPAELLAVAVPPVEEPRFDLSTWARLTVATSPDPALLPSTADALAFGMEVLTTIGGFNQLGDHYIAPGTAMLLRLTCRQLAEIDRYVLSVIAGNTPALPACLAKVLSPGKVVANA